MRAFVLPLALSLLLAGPALAQQEPSQSSQRTTVKILGDYSGLTAEDRDSYCFWSGQLFSIGASFCSRQQTLSTCTEVAGRRPVWLTKDNDKFCDKNPSATPN
jgi:hypothetical protein